MSSQMKDLVSGSCGGCSFPPAQWDKRCWQLIMQMWALMSEGFSVSERNKQEEWWRNILLPDQLLTGSLCGYFRCTLGYWIFHASLESDKTLWGRLCWSGKHDTESCRHRLQHRRHKPKLCRLLSSSTHIPAPQAANPRSLIDRLTSICD